MFEISSLLPRIVTLDGRLLASSSFAFKVDSLRPIGVITLTLASSKFVGPCALALTVCSFSSFDFSTRTGLSVLTLSSEGVIPGVY